MSTKSPSDDEMASTESGSSSESVETDRSATTDRSVDATTGPSGTGLDSNVAGALAYLLGPITGIAFYVLEPDDEFVRFHAVQSIAVFGGFFVLSIVLSVVLGALSLVPGIGWIIGIVLGLGSFLLAPIGLVVWAFLMYKAYNNERYAVPVVGRYAERYATESSEHAV
ncbi:DUF4870 domain-containing protein [Halalkalirubrum salinum]|uniref:DUF4870 domain-containing protein n=1 Tax=Halalkalirubrum salinum TaxID=2563889 RepID=UPI00197ACCD5|nr:DUF4870 domain-containing protein [Halalkalirubrum salinum]